MKTTVEIPDALLIEAKQLAASQHTTVRALIEQGLAVLRERDAAGCVVLGEPDYYGRFGFAHDPALTYPGPPPEYFRRLVIEGPGASGGVTYAPAFG